MTVSLKFHQTDSNHNIVAFIMDGPPDDRKMLLLNESAVC